MWLLVDDQRDLGCEVIARTPDIAKKILFSQISEFDCVCFDHDLGCIETGYDVLKYPLELDLLPNRVQLVTSNLVGRENMGKLLNDYMYVSKDRINYYRS